METQTAADELPEVDCYPDTHPVEAWKEGKLTIGWSGGGFLLPYFLGVYQSLAAMGIIHAGTPMAGSSAGSLVSIEDQAARTLTRTHRSSYKDKIATVLPEYLALGEHIYVTPIVKCMTAVSILDCAQHHFYRRC